MINFEKVPREVFLIAEKVCLNGGSLCLVGGSLRDLLLGNEPKEYDFEIYANDYKKNEYRHLSLEKKEIYSTSFIESMKEVLLKFGDINEHGKNFGVIKMKKKPYDFSFPRKENKSGLTRKDYEVSLNPFLNFKEAQKRRDITINSLIYSFNDNSIIDNYKGLEDIQRKIIKHVDPLTFIEDPLRIYRIAQFVSRLNFNVHPETMYLCQKMELQSLSIERIHWEMEKLFQGKHIFAGLKFLSESKVFLKRHKEFDEFFAEILDKSYEIDRSNYYAKEEMKMIDKFAFVFIVAVNENELEKHLDKIKRALGTFSNNKKEIIGVVKNLEIFDIIIRYQKNEIKYNEAFIKLLSKKPTFMEEYLNFWSEIHHEEVNKAQNFVKDVLDFTPLITGNDLKKIGIEQSEEYQAILKDSINMQIQGLNKETILEKIKESDYYDLSKNNL